MLYLFEGKNELELYKFVKMGGDNWQPFAAWLRFSWQSSEEVVVKNEGERQIYLFVLSIWFWFLHSYTISLDCYFWELNFCFLHKDFTYFCFFFFFPFWQTYFCFLKSFAITFSLDHGLLNYFSKFKLYNCDCLLSDLLLIPTMICRLWWQVIFQ